MPRYQLNRNHRRIAEVLAGERAIVASIRQSARSATGLATLNNITRSIADVFAQSSATFDRDAFYRIAGLPPLE